MPTQNFDQSTQYNNICLNLSEFMTNDVLSALRQLKPKFTKGPDEIPAFVVRDCANVLAEPLTIIFNLSLKTGTFPDIWKRSQICPVYKKGNKHEIENHRPITIICNFAKVFEIALHAVIYPHAEGQITQCQHGFVKNRSTVTNLMCITQYISQNLDTNTQVDVLYTDFSKAFDRLDHIYCCINFKLWVFLSYLLIFLNRILVKEHNMWNTVAKGPVKLLLLQGYLRDLY